MHPTDSNQHRSASDITGPPDPSEILSDLLRIPPYARKHLDAQLPLDDPDPDPMQHGFIVRQLANAPYGVFRGRYMTAAGELDPDKVTDWAADVKSLGEFLSECTVIADYINRYQPIRDEIDRLQFALRNTGASAFVERPPAYVLRDLSRLLHHMGDLCNPDIVDPDILGDGGVDSGPTRE